MAPSSSMTAEADYSCGGRPRRRFAVACSVLSHCVRAAETAAASSRSATASPMLLMPGADVPIANDDEEEEETVMPTMQQQQQLTIAYGGRVVAVFEDVPAERAAEVMRVAAAAAALQGQGQGGMPGGGCGSGGGGGGLLPDLQVARKASLQRLLEKRRRDRLRARASSSASYAPAAAAAAAVAKEEQPQQEKDAERWLVLGIPG